MKEIAPPEARGALAASEEIALLDVREAGQYGEGHPLPAVPLPYSRLEIEAPALLPARHPRLILLDDGDGVALKAAKRLEAMGYKRVEVLQGGAAGWATAGYTLFQGVNVPSKTFGELVEHARHTPSLDAEQLKALQDRGAPLLLLDGRGPDEHRRMNIPGSIGVPNAELGYRLSALLRDETTPIVVHCAGRTRSIIGAESLRLLGIPNPVHALRNGTQGWRLSGFELEHGSDLLYPPLSEENREATRDRARKLIESCRIPLIDLTQLDALRANAERTLYMLDVRTEEEFAAGHLFGARHAPGGQLVQATDQWVAVRNARIVLCDDTGLRAAITAHWLRQMGHDAIVLDTDVTARRDLVHGTEKPPRIDERLPIATLEELKLFQMSGATLIDLNPGMAYRKAHIAGAHWGIRPRLDQLRVDKGKPVILLVQDRRLAELAAIDLVELGFGDIRYAPGAEADWRAAGFDVVAVPNQPSDADCIDYLFFGRHRHDGNLDAARRYLEWETGLPAQLDEADRAMFRLADPQ